MGNRLQLHSELCDLLGSRNVYFQPPESVKLSYDCIIYERSNILSRWANNSPYINKDRYQVTVIYKNPDNNITKRLLGHFKYSGFESHFTTDNLNHDVLSIYY